jgi:hypothetical protein
MSNPISDQWQKLGDEFHMMMGYCIAEWAQVDESLFEIFHTCVGPREQCAIIYYRIPGLDPRFSLTDEIVCSVLPQRDRKSGGHDHPDVKLWKETIGKYQGLLNERRRIAHHPVALRTPWILDIEMIGAMGLNGSALPAGPSHFEIYVNHNESLREKSSDLPALSVGDLRLHLAKVNKFHGDLRRFLRDVLLKRHEEHLPQSPQPPNGEHQSDTPPK